MATVTAYSVPVLNSNKYFDRESFAKLWIIKADLLTLQLRSQSVISHSPSSTHQIDKLGYKKGRGVVILLSCKKAFERGRKRTHSPVRLSLFPAHLHWSLTLASRNASNVFSCSELTLQRATVQTQLEEEIQGTFKMFCLFEV